MKLLILGLDGLDPDLVERWRMDWFKQETYGRHYVGFFKDLYTPILWGSLLTGLNVEEHGYSMKELKEKRIREAFRSRLLYILYKLRTRILPKRRLGVRKIFVKMRLIDPYPPSVMPENLLRQTFLEELKSRGYRVVAIEVPGYNETRNEYYRSQLVELAGASFTKKKALIDEALEDTRERIAKTLSFIDEGYDLVFMYTPLPDIALHLAVKPTLHVKTWLRTIHRRLYDTISEAIRHAKERNYAVLIVSDHGFNLEKNYHSDYGFWSLSIRPPTWWNINTILDFKKNIVKLVSNLKLNTSRY